MKPNFLEPILKDRMKEVDIGGSSYLFDRWIFKGVIVLVFLFLFYVAYSNNFQLNYFECNVGGVNINNTCVNPFYKPVTWENSRYLYPGKYGNDPRRLINLSWIVTFSLLILGFCINHFVYNKGKNILKIFKEED